MALLDDLSTGWLVLTVFAAVYVLAAAIYFCVMALARGRRADAFKAVSPGLLPPMGLLFGLLVGVPRRGRLERFRARATGRRSGGERPSVGRSPDRRVPGGRCPHASRSFAGTSTTP